jgi:hypothetical protein
MTETAIYQRQTRYYKPHLHNKLVTVVGCGSLGGNIAVALAKMGLNNFHLWDGDIVERHNVPNQPFGVPDLGRTKSNAIKRMLLSQYDQTTQCNVMTYDHWHDSNPIEPGLIISAPDSINVRKMMYERRPEKGFLIDVRSGPESYNIYCCDLQNAKDMKFYSSTFFDESNQVSAGCGAQSTVFGSLAITAMAINCYMRWVNKKRYPIQVLGDLMSFDSEQTYVDGKDFCGD